LSFGSYEKGNKGDVNEGGGGAQLRSGCRRKGSLGTGAEGHNLRRPQAENKNF